MGHRRQQELCHAIWMSARVLRSLVQSLVSDDASQQQSYARKWRSSVTRLRYFEEASRLAPAEAACKAPEKCLNGLVHTRAYII